MKSKFLPIHQIILALCLLTSTIALSQVGIGTETPHASSILDLQSNSQGLLAPRMTTIERTSIPSPAESLLVYDTVEKGFYFYNSTTSSWIKLANDTTIKRSNYKLIKSAADLAQELSDGGGNSYVLNTNTYYEINGTISLAKPIDLNNAYISGIDANEDVLSSTGIVFKGNTGGSIKNLTLTGAKAFEITGPGLTSNTSLLVQNTIITGMSASVGSISGLGLYFGNIIQFLNNTNGITYSNIGNLLLNNLGWFGNNSGTFEKFTGTFGLIEKVSGFSSVNGTAVGLDVSSDGLSVGTGILQGTVFTGNTTAPSGYVKGYTEGSYPGFNFTNAWTVNAPGIPREGDAEATGDINFTAAVGTGAETTFSGTGTVSRTKIKGTTTSKSLFRFKKEGDNKITYTGSKKRYFQVSASVSYQGDTELTVILYIAKNGIVLPETKVYGRGTSGKFAEAGILALPIIGTVELKNNDSIEIWAERFSGAGSMGTVSLNLIAR